MQQEISQKVVEAILKNSQEKILLLKRSNKNKSFKGLWQLPGGKVEKNEVIEEALKREIEEEIGIKLCEYKKKEEINFEHSFNGFKGKLLLFVFAGSCPDKVSLTLSEEHSAFGFFFIDEIKKMHLAPTSKKALQLE
jgi:mutator protein MutT